MWSTCTTTTSHPPWVLAATAWAMRPFCSAESAWSATTRSTTTEGTTSAGDVVDGTEGTRGTHRAEGPGTTPA